jgi:hypothetical protein
MATTLWQLPQVRFGAGYGTVMVATVVVTAMRLAPDPALLVLGLVTVLWASRLPLGLATALGAVSWAYYTGFVVNQYGQLTFAAGDLIRLVLLLVVASAAHWS